MNSVSTVTKEAPARPSQKASSRAVSEIIGMGRCYTPKHAPPEGGRGCRGPSYSRFKSLSGQANGAMSDYSDRVYAAGVPQERPFTTPVGSERRLFYHYDVHRVIVPALHV